MTPPDSGERCPWIVSGARSGRCLLSSDHVGPHKPDDPREPGSGEREVCGHRDPEWCCTRLVGHSGDHRYWHMRNPPPSISLPLSLAQRILAALEEAYGFVPMAGKELQALAAELRALVTR